MHLLLQVLPQHQSAGVGIATALPSGLGFSGLPVDLLLPSPPIFHEVMGCEHGL